MTHFDTTLWENGWSWEFIEFFKHSVQYEFVLLFCFVPYVSFLLLNNDYLFNYSKIIHILFFMVEIWWIVIVFCTTDAYIELKATIFSIDQHIKR